MVASCGGGGSESGNSANTQTQTKTEEPQADNQAPKVSIIGETQVSEQTVFTLTAEASDDKAVTSYLWEYEAGGAELELQSPEQSIVTVSVGDIEQDLDVVFFVTVADNEGLTQTAQHTLIVKATPTAEIAGPESVVTPGEFTLTALHSSEVNSEALSYQWQHDSAVPLELSGQDNETLNVKAPILTQPTDVTFKLTVTNEAGVSQHATHSVTLVPKVNLAPQVSVTGVSEVQAGGSFSLSANATDSDGQITSYQWRYESDSTLSLSGSDTANLLVVTPSVSQVTQALLTVTVTDGSGLTSSATHNVTIQPTVNIKPVVTITGPAIVEESSQITLTADASDPDGEIVRYEWLIPEDAPITATDAQSAQLIISADTVSQDTQALLKVTVTDDSGLTSSATHSVTIQPAVNVEPVVTITGPAIVEESSPITLTADASDPDGEIVRYEWQIPEDTPITATGAQSAQLVISAHTVSQDTQALLTVTVTDDSGLTSSATHSVTIQPTVNVEPVVTITGPAIVEESSQITLTADASDPDGEVVRYEWQIPEDAPITVTGAQSAQLVISAQAISQDTQVSLAVVVTDERGATAQDEFTLTLQALPNVKPTVSIQSNQTEFQEKLAFILTAAADDSDGQISAYQWSHNGSAELQISGEQSAELNVISADLTEDTEVTFTVTVTDNQGETNADTFTATIFALKHRLTLRGKVTDEPIQYANVSLRSGEKHFQAQASETGEYELSVVLDEADINAMMTLEASGINTQSHVTLVSMLGELGNLVQAAGADSVLDAEEQFSVNITNLTTVEYALIQQNEESVANHSELQRAKRNIDPEEKLALASTLKAVIDHGYALPDGLASTLELARDLPKARALLRAIKATDPVLFRQIREDIKQDSDLMQQVTFVPDGTYYLSESSYFNGFAASLTFNSDNTGELQSTESTSFTWQQSGTQLQLNLDSPISVYESGNYFNPDYQVNQLSLKLYQHGEQAQSAEVTMQKVATGDQPGEFTEPFQGHFIAANNLPELEKANLLGHWSINIPQTRSLAQAYSIEFLEYSRANITSTRKPETVSWRLEGNQLRYLFGNFSYKITVVRKFELGLQVLVELKPWYGEQQLFPAILVRHQNTSFDDINYVKTWTPEKLKGERESFLIDEHNNFQFTWDRDIQATMLNGNLVRHNYTFAGENVEYCDTTSEHCQTDHNFEYELLAKQGELIAVKYSSIDLREATPTHIGSKVFVFRLSEEPLATNAFTDAFVSQNNNYYIFGGRPNLFAVSDNKTVHLKGMRYCHSGEDNVSRCDDAIDIDGQKYWVTLSDELVHLTHIETNEQSFLQLLQSDENGVTLCHFNEAQTCTDANTNDYAFSRPQLDIQLNLEGSGQAISSSSEYRYKQSFSVLLVPDGGATLSEVSGCDGTVDSDNEHGFLYSVVEPLADCTIQAVFSKQAPYDDAMVLFNDALDIPHSWYFEFDWNNTGRLYSRYTKIDFSIERVSEELYWAQFDLGYFDYITLRLGNNEKVHATGFKLDYRESGLYLIWQAWNPNTQSSYDLTPILVKNSKEVAATELTPQSMVGDWVLTYGAELEDSRTHTDQYLSISLQDDNQGVVTSTDYQGMPWNHDITWSITQDDRLRLEDYYGNVAKIKMFEQTEYGYKFAIESINDDSHDANYNSFWFQRGTGVLLKRQSELKLENLTGKWRFSEGNDERGFELYPGGQYRDGKHDGAFESSWSDGVLSVMTKYNEQLGYDPVCDQQEPSCELRELHKFEVIRKQGNHLYVLDHSGSYGRSAKILRTVTLDSDPVLTQFESYLFWDTEWSRRDRLKLYEVTESITRYWRIYKSTHYSSPGLKLDIEGQEVSSLTLVDGKLREEVGELVYWIEIVSSNADGILVCRYMQGSRCDESNQHFLSYEIPSYQINIGASEGGSIETNLPGNYQLYNQPLELKINYDHGMVVERFKECGLGYSRRLSSLHSRVLTFVNENVKQACELDIQFSPRPANQSDRLGITDPLLTACVNKFNEFYDPHIEYLDALKCDGDGALALDSLAGLTLFDQLEEFTLVGVPAISSQAKQQLQQLTELKKLTLRDVEFSDLDFSMLTQLEALTLEVDSLAQLSLPKHGELESLTLTGDGPQMLDITDLSQLETLSIGGSGIQSLDVDGALKLRRIYANGSQLASIFGMSESHLLESLTINNTPMSELDLTHYVNLESLYMEDTQIAELDITNATQLQRIIASRSELQRLATFKPSPVRELHLSETQLTAIELGMMPELKKLDVQSARLQKLDLTGADALKRVVAQNNQIGEVVMPASSQVDELYLDNNLLTEFSLTGLQQNEHLHSFSLKGNQLTQFDGTQFDNLYNLNLSDNPISRLALKHEQGIWTLVLDNTILTELDLSGFNRLNYLSINNTHIANITIPATIDKLYASGTNITELNLPDGLSHAGIYFRGNQLDSLSVADSVGYTRLYLGDTEISEQVNEVLQSSYRDKVAAYRCDERDWCFRIN
ncbi:PKD domain-containing protein [Pseudoalteromonas sp. DL2-H2.2]|uniref:PKD domain-containing protein n=1 Tax=Pseudoalteromonas sp. DL2-H2.2 TaxID=2908889 RepID=UPI001F17A5A3|nr:leucine-rich repeat domain-containing protein [Pseudoalteromonas sp. DL2-H2.2]MCF2910825.1 PKD domain-containing protein [Pseudoalteromonas sp. DL2-H2.2]